MDERWEQVKQILHEAVELPEAERGLCQQSSGDGSGAGGGAGEFAGEFFEAEEFMEEAPVQLGALGMRWKAGGSGSITLSG